MDNPKQKYGVRERVNAILKIFETAAVLEMQGLIRWKLHKVKEDTILEMCLSMDMAD